MRTAFPFVGWVVTRAVTLWLLYGAESWVTGDAGYFAASLQAVPDLGLRHVLVEYPLPAVAVVAVPWLLAAAAGVPGAYPDLLMLAALTTDAAFAVLLHRSGRRPDRGLWLWILAVPLLGATAYARFDLLPGVLVGAALLLLADRPRLAAGCVAAAGAVKLWPVLLLPGLLAGVTGHLRRRQAVVVVAVTGGLLAAASVAVGGWGRLLSPLAFQGERGLQIESLAASPAMVGWWQDPARWHVGYASSHAYEVVGPGVGLLLACSTFATVLVLLALVGAWAWAWRLRDRLSSASVVWLALVALSGWVCAGKVLSPQYLLWLLPAAAAAVVLRGGDRPLLVWCAGLLLATALTHLVFPTYYGGLLAAGPDTGRAAVALLARNLLMAGLFGFAALQTWRTLRVDAQRGRALDRQPPGPAGGAVRTNR